jgi:hypothetical protein
MPKLAPQDRLFENGHKPVVAFASHDEFERVTQGKAQINRLRWKHV